MTRRTPTLLTLTLSGILTLAACGNTSSDSDPPTTGEQAFTTAAADTFTPEGPDADRWLTDAHGLIADTCDTLTTIHTDTGIDPTAAEPLTTMALATVADTWTGNDQEIGLALLELGALHLCPQHGDTIADFTEARRQAAP